MYNKYKISKEDTFIIGNYPEIENEVTQLSASILRLPNVNKCDITISFLKDHKIKNEWIAANPELTKFITMAKYISDSMESLFESCKMHLIFSSDYESYICKCLNQHVEQEQHT